MIHQDFILLIISCEKYKFKAELQKGTWLQTINDYNINNPDKSIIYYHIIGDPLLKEEYVIDESESILYVKVEDDYNSLPKKMMKSFQAINNTYKFKYIFKTDDDQVLLDVKFLVNLQKILLLNWSNEDKQVNYGGQVVTIEKPYLSQYHTIHPELPPNLPLLQTSYCSGRFYILSNLSIKYLITKEKYIIKEYLEDYAIGYNLHQLFKKNMLDLETSKYFIDSK
jgi:hypothetical protein